MGDILKLHVIAAIVVIVNGVQTVSVSDTPACQEDSTGVNYRGDLSQTINGHTCQAWTSQDPHQHDYTPADFSKAGLDDNYCRNPDNGDTAWCYTTIPGIRWEYCAVGFLDPRCKALHDVHDVCPHVTMMSCPLTTLESGETVQLIPKPMQSDLDWLISNLPADLQIHHDVQRYYCTEPACLSHPCLHGDTCEETDTGFTCLCLERHCGERCEEDVTIHSLKLLGEKKNEGTLALSSCSSPNTYVLVHQDHWNKNLSQMACQYLGFEGVFATVSGPLYESSSVDVPAEAESVICPANTTNITDCWYSETKVGRINESETISIVCCPVNPCNISGRPLGLESGALSDSAFSVSSCYTVPYCSGVGRLNSETAWISYVSDQYQWMQVQFESSYIVTAITTQGRNDADQWVTSYTCSSSFDDTAWTNYLNVYSGSVEIFPGNYDRNSHVTQTLARPIVGRSFRIHPKTNHVQISLRMELYGYGPLTDAITSLNLDAKLGCTPPVLGEGLGVEDGRIPDSSLTSSSILDSYHAAYRARLNEVYSAGLIKPRCMDPCPFRQQ
ncbi:EGF-like repeat and discoidin I-like domain-containing protein 3 [Strongylocentrotus purpuratus]|uniref:Uncharacterized protein n=1 Tax=Strongylocentrotus purpuratus TaxID=7668 RepID=A0A7M7NFN8_STRPU|nr:EGF-like repeat and discoidin I-like domain-containing protein 3 [Strongylocentrotus purpuratus]XP_030834309.1 EGF-like repeat and discoidin I-like domain-containing protein 3 [Strongylocentrotus purpuratus]XP_030834310.1 EGF-like repeat and discoidin I-like domain-containing protein 3 [Strongylocentrotus purpuratus]XP_030834311.1 EGF-like repeat and discoidin I-like domain-containing protein 3 [Strongylocentrotus purpuratus]